MSSEMIQSACIGLCLRYAEGEDVRQLVSDDLCVMPLLSWGETRRHGCGSPRERRKGAENA